MPVSSLGGIAAKNASNAAMPPADAPIPTTGNAVAPPAVPAVPGAGALSGSAGAASATSALPSAGVDAFAWSDAALDRARRLLGVLGLFGSVTVLSLALHPHAN